MTSEWPLVPLRAVATPVARAVVPMVGCLYRQIGVRLWGEGAYERETIDGAATKYTQLFRAEAGDIVVNKIWARNGSVAVVQPELAGAFGSGEFPMFQLDQAKVIPRWVHWITKMPSFWADCDEKSRGTSGKNRIKPDRFLDIRIPLPTVAEQRRIVERIEAIAGKVEEARRLKQEAMESLGVLRSICAERERLELLRQFPELSLAEVSHSITDGDHNTPSFDDSGIRFIFVGNVSSAILHFDGARYVSRDYFEKLHPRRVPTRGDILFSAVGATLGIPAVVETDEPFCFQRHIAILKLNQAQVIPKFVWHMLQATSVFRAAWRATTGSAQPTIPLRGIRGLSIPVPPLEVQIDAVARLERVRAATGLAEEDNQSVITGLGGLLPAVLDKAFRGEM